MPILFWVIAITLGGVVLVAVAQPKVANRSTRAWPGGITSQQAMRAISWAITNENDFARLRSFARTVEQYDRAAAQRIYDRALLLEVAKTRSVSVADPAYRRLGFVVSALKTMASKGIA